MTAEVHVLKQVEAPKVSDMLREMAESIDAGKYGEPDGAVVVLAANNLLIFGLGGADGTTSHYLLGCAMQKLQGPMVDK